MKIYLIPIIPFIIVTAHANDEMGKKDFMKLKAEKIIVGPHSYIEKPVVPSEYIARVREALGISGDTSSDSESIKDKIKDGLKNASKEKLKKVLDALGEE